MTKKTLFISDLHLCDEHTRSTRLFLDFLESSLKEAEALYILGDFFNVWIGDDNQTPFNHSIQKALKKASSQIPIYFMPGNRDFLLGNDFLKKAGGQLLPDPFEIDLYGTPTLLTHGDALCTEEKKHIWFRRIVQHSFTKSLYLALPLSLRRKIAQALRKKSQAHITQTPRSAMLAHPAAVNKLMERYGVQYMIHGHTHEHKIYEFTLAGKTATRTVLGDWDKRGSVLVCEPEKQTLVSLS